jgi:uncharacterized integral membrane protein
MDIQPENRPAGGSDAPEPLAPQSPDLLPPVSQPSELQSPDLQPPVGDIGTTPVRRTRGKVPSTRTSAAWLGVWAGVAALILLIIFVAQNTRAVEVSFLWMHGQISLALALLIAGVGGAVVAMAVAAVRIVQLRRLLHRRP